jgi:predicted RNase H-like HicB family nuclease
MIPELSDARLVVIYPDPSGHWVAKCPSLPYLFAAGEDYDEAKANMSKVIRLDLLFRLRAGQKPPDDQTSFAVIITEL